MSSKDLLALAQSKRFKSLEEFIAVLRPREDHPAGRLGAMVAEGPGAWKLLLAATPCRRVLEVGAGPESIIHHLAGTKGSFLLADSSSGRLAFSQCFHKLRKQTPKISYVQLEKVDTLPFDDDSFDCAVINLRQQKPYYYRPLLHELRRILSSSGELFAVVGNRFYWDRLGLREFLTSPHFTLAGYQKLLRKSGFPQADSWALVYHDSDLRKVIPFTGTGDGNRNFLSATPQTLKARLKQGLMSKEYAVISRLGPGPSLLDSIIKDASHSLKAALGPGSLTAQDHEITRKEKVVFFTQWAETKLILKVPLSNTALATETNNAEVLGLLGKDLRINEYVPRSLATGMVEDSRYFIETRISGAPLSELIAKHGRKHYLNDAFSLLERLASISSGAKTDAFTGDSYERLVERPIASIARFAGDTSLGTNLGKYFRSKLYGAEIKLGLTHGDFSVSNILHNNNKPLSIIDWETAELQGIPALDAINFLDSLQRFSVKGARINQTIPQLAARDWPEPSELQFLNQCYELLRVDQALHEQLVYLRWLRHMGFLIQFWLRFDRAAQKTFIYEIAGKLV